MNTAKAISLALCVAALAGCPDDETIKTPFVDKFDRVELGSNWLNTGANYKIVDGKINVKGAYNHPLWLKKRLPRNAVIELDVMSKSGVGDIKVEAWGDGQSYATRKGAYLATSYVFIFGGWGNRISALCRMDEHANDRKTRSDLRVKPGQTYHWKIKRQGNKVEWFVDGKPFLAMDDKDPLTGNNHAYFGFNNWQSDLYFDNLKITPLK
ncbi:MAG: DUF1080 domain-containing protein [Myxococcales bacterium]|nr:DUF1080 domain-containing protein [Myxococcales bacterium]